MIFSLRLQCKDSYILKKRGTLRPLLVPELHRSDGTDYATLWLLNF